MGGMHDLSIAIDGPAGSGKSVVARALARELGLLYVDTGAMYRAVTWKALQTGVSLDAREAMATLARAIRLELRPDPGTPSGYRVMADGEDITSALSSPEVDGVVGRVAAQPLVRQVLSRRQREIGLQGGVVMVGRDIATVVLPEARYKIYLDASLEERARRRLLELNGRGKAIDFDTVLAQMRERDRLDTERETAPLQVGEGAMVVDTTHCTIDETVSTILGRIRATQTRS